MNNDLAATNWWQVLLKNDGVLPLSAASTTSIAIIGKEAAFPTTHGGGSGQVFPGYVATPLWSVRNKLSFPQPALPTSNCSDGNFDVGYDYRNTDSQTSQVGTHNLALRKNGALGVRRCLAAWWSIVLVNHNAACCCTVQSSSCVCAAKGNVASVADCCELCAQRLDGNCNYFTYSTGDQTCWMKATNHNRIADGSVVSGGCHSSPPPPQDPCQNGVCMCVLGSPVGSCRVTCLSLSVRERE